MISIYRSSIKKRALCSSIALALVAGFSGVVSAQEDNAIKVLEEVMVTARRREESAQDVPVAVTAVSSEQIYRQNITDIDDLTATVPGVNFTKSGAGNNTVFSIRGRSRGVFGNALPAVNSYVNEVPLNIQGANLPTYDMASLQVLKGPQGTLFGRNSTSGAVLVATEAPTHEFGGNVIAKVGRYNSRVLSGAINIPIVQGKVALRIAGQLDERDGYTKDGLNTAPDDFDNRDRENYRISLLIEPTESFSNLFIYESNEADERPGGIVPVGYRPNQGTVAFFPWTNGGATYIPGAPDGAGGVLPPRFPGDIGSGYTLSPVGIPVPCGGSPTCDIGVIAARQDAAGPREVFHSNPGIYEVELDSFSNTTIWDAGSFTIKNIIGYREVHTYTQTDIDGTQLKLVEAFNDVGTEQFTEELQIAGEAMDGDLEYIAGLFYLKSEPNDKNRLALQLFSQSSTPPTSPVAAIGPFGGAFGAGDFYTDTSKAAYGQISYQLTDDLSVDFGLRHTKDKSQNCPVAATLLTTPSPTENACTQSISIEFSKTTYNVSLNYQVNDDILLYVTSRSGYRAGGVNSPNFGGLLADFQSYDPEEVQDIELGMKSDWRLGDVYGRFNVALYQSEYEGVHYAIPTSGVSPLLPAGVDGDGDPTNEPSGGLFTGNAGDATIKGIEIDLVAQLTESLEVSVGGAYMDRELDTKLSLPATLQPFAGQLATQKDIEAFVFLAAPDWSYNVSATYTLPLDSDIGEVALSARYFTISGIHFGGNIFADEYSSTDMRLDWYGMMGSSLDAAVYVTNLTDEEEIVAPASSGANIGINSAIFNEPRMWGVSLRYSF